MNAPRNISIGLLNALFLYMLKTTTFYGFLFYFVPDYVTKTAPLFFERVILICRSVFRIGMNNFLPTIANND